MNRREGYHLPPLTDHRGTELTRAELAANERLGDTGWTALTPRPVVRDPALVGLVVAMQERAS